ncbi:PAS domain S-box protein [Candidatus Latescibacterota bacterium]
MNDSKKTKDRLIAELNELRKQVSLPDSKDLNQKHSFEFLKNENQFFNYIFDSLDDPIYVMDRNYRYVYLNDKSCEVWQQDRNVLLKKTYSDLFDKESAKKLKEEDDLVFEKGKTVQNDLHVELHGEMFVYSITKSLFITAHNKNKYIVGICRDVTKQKNAESALKDNEELLRQIIDLDPHQIYVRDENGKYLLVNKASAQALKSSVEKVTGEYVIDLFPDKKFAREILDLDKQIISSQNPSIVKDRRLTDLDGNIKYFDTLKIPFTTPRLKTPAVLGIGLDITGLKEAEKARRESENNYRNLIERANDGIFVAQDGLIKFSNDRLAEMCGYNAEEITNTPFIDYVCPEERKKVKKIYENRMKGEDVPAIYELCILHKDGSRFDIEANVGVITYKGKPAILVFVRDISERKIIEQVLRKSEEQYRLLVNNQTDLIVKVSPEGKIIYASPSYCKMFGKTEEELLGKRYMPLVHEEDKERTRLAIEKNLLNPPYSLSLEQRCKTIYGWRWISWVDTSILNDKNEVIEIVGAGRDIHEQKIAEQALQKSEEQYRLIVDNQTDLILKVDRKNKILFASPSYCKIFGKSEQELLGKTFMPLVHKDDRERTNEAMKKMLQPPYSIYLEQRVMTLKGWRWYAWVDSAILNDKNEVIEIIGIGRDINDRKLAEQALQEAKDNLEDRIQERTKELTQVNKQLEKDIIERKKAEKQLLKSESVLKHQKLDIEQKTIALKEVIGQIEYEKNSIKDDIAANINDIIIPIIDKLRQNDQNSQYVDLLWHAVKKITHSFGRKITHYSHKLTTREIEICILVEKGFTNKEISSLINISAHTVEKHRRNIRAKLGISNKNINLTTYLRQM